MRTIGSKTLAVAALALASFVTPSLAGSPYYDTMGEPMTADQADMTYNGMMHPGMMPAQTRPAGHFSCSPYERRTRLQRQACGATRGMY